MLVSGDAGIGKSRLIAEVALRARDALVISGAATSSGTEPYGPLVAALRVRLRSDPSALVACGPLTPHLALILPELGVPPVASDRPTLFEAIRCALAHLAGDQLVLMMLEDLQWSDEATLELLTALAEPLSELSLLVVGSYRSDGLPRDHGVRRLRHELRRCGRLDEVTLGPLVPDEVAVLLATALGDRPAPSLVRSVHDATHGTPFFVEELAGALRVSGALRAGRAGLELVRHGEVPLPDTVRDAVLVSAAGLSEQGRAAAEAAAVAGDAFDVELVVSLSSLEGVGELLECGLVREQAGATGFRHGLARDALYADVPWTRRRSLHRAIAEALEAAGAPSREIASHWLGARDGSRARDALLRAAADAEAVHAFRDGAEAGRKALDLWPEDADEDEDGGRRAEALERYARCAELAGELGEATRAWRDLAELQDGLARAGAQRRLAAVLELRGERQPAFIARRLASEGFAAHGAPADAATELLAMANQQRIAARHGEAIELARRASSMADAADRLDLRLRAQGLEGMARAKHGDYAAGVAAVRDALAVALDSDMTAVAADLYQRLSLALYESADFRHAEEALETALALCQATGDTGVEIACVMCLAYVLRERGEWPRAAEMCREMMASGTAALVAEGLLGSIHANEGRLSSARRLLSSCRTAATGARHYNMTIDSTAALARVAAAEGADDEVREHCRSLLELWEQSDDRHYAIAGLRWGASWSATRKDAAVAHTCTIALSRIASQTGHPDALAALACAIGETALMEGDATTAAEQITRAFELHRDLDIPFERAQVELRSGVALASAGERELALERLIGSHRLARRLGARPLAAEAAREVAVLGESVSRRLGVRAAADADGAGLSRRELEVVRLLAVGRTNREIAHDLFLSTRTVDMHVRNILRKLDCRSRVQASQRAGELGLLAS